MNKVIEIAKGYLPYIIALIVFSCFVFSPELQSKKLSSADSVSWYGSAKELLNYLEKGEDIKWTNRVFSGMPLYAIGGNFSGNFAMSVYYKLTEWFGANIILFIFLTCSAFFSLVLLNIDKRIALICAFLFGINTWIIDSLIASHGTKILAVGFLFLVVGGLISFYRSNSFYGLIGVGIGMLFQIGINHLQVTYYGAIVCAILVLFFLVQSFRRKTLLNFLKKSSFLLMIVGLAILANFSNLWILKDYSKETMRGGKSELVKPGVNSTGKEGGLDINYAFNWSYMPSELFNFIVPDAKGGSSNYRVKPGKSKLAEGIGQNQIPLYWGEQPFTGAPNYVGITLFFLIVFTFFYWKNSIKWSFLIIVVLFSAMGLGRFFLEFNQILFDYLPLYNKFRTPTMSFSMVSLSFIFLGGLGLNQLIHDDKSAEMVKALKHSIFAMVGIMLLGFLAISSGGYTSSHDMKIFGQNTQALDLIIADRESFFKSDFLRGFFLILLMAGLLWMYITKRLEQKWFVLIIGFLMVGELYMVTNRFYDKEAFQKVDKIEDLIPDEPYNQFLEQDTTYFRIFNTTTDAFNNSMDGYRFCNVGGYSPAKLYRYQDLIDVHLSAMNMNVLNMLNTKYFIVDQNGQKLPQMNPEACGNVWFPAQVKFAKNANEEIDSIGVSLPKQTVWVDKRYQNDSKFNVNTDPMAEIKLTKYHPERLEYFSHSASGGFAVFSEIWYKGNEDWKIYIDDKPIQMVRTNYLLRGAYIPAGNHKIEMRYSQETLDKLKIVGRFATAFLLLILFFAPFIDQKWKKIVDRT